jgi:serine protease Do
MAAGGVIALGVGERVVERPVTERVALNPTLAGLDGPASLDGVRQRVAPAVVGVGSPDDGTTGDGSTGDGSTGDGSTGGAIAGSGVVVRDDGIVITSAALVTTVGAAAVHLPDGSLTTAQVLATDQATGLAVLDLAGEGYTPSVLAGAADLMAGEQSYVMSATGSVDPTSGTGAGTVGPTERYVGPSGTALDGVEVRGDAGEGALGAPVVNDRGVVVGIVTTVDAGEAWYLAPVEVAHKVADDILADGTVHHSWLGIEGTDVPGAGAAGSPDTTLPTEGGGTQVVSVAPDSPAGRGGLVPGDVIVALDGEPVTRMPDLLVLLRSRSPGDRVDVTVTRADGGRVTLVLTLTGPPLP